MTPLSTQHLTTSSSDGRNIELGRHNEAFKDYEIDLMLLKMNQDSQCRSTFETSTISVGIDS